MWKSGENRPATLPMLRQHEIEIRVRYSETDPMGLLHHANYFTYFEIGRTELLRASGGSHREMEEVGLLVVGMRRMSTAMARLLWGVAFLLLPRYFQVVRQNLLTLIAFRLKGFQKPVLALV